MLDKDYLLVDYFTEPSKITVRIAKGEPSLEEHFTKGTLVEKAVSALRRVTWCRRLLPSGRPRANGCESYRCGAKNAMSSGSGALSEGNLCMYASRVRTRSDCTS